MAPPNGGRRDETHSQEERRKAEEESDRKKIVAALDAIAKKTGSGENKSRIAKYARWFIDWATLVGIWGAACVAIWAICISSRDAQSQQMIMQGQLKATIVQLRPYMGPEKIQVTPICPEDRCKDLGRFIIVFWKNFGATPARNISGWVCYGRMRDRNIASFDFTKPVEGPYKDKFCSFSGPSGKIATLGPGAELPAGRLRIDPGDIAALREDSRWQLVVWGEAQYDDPFPNSNRHSFRSCQEGDAAADGGGFEFYVLSNAPECNISD